MRAFLSPKDLAVAIGASESSLKRWTDSGLLTATRTAGGHRRIPLAEAVRFIRQSKIPILRPDVLGLPDLAEISVQASGDRPAGEQLFEALRADKPGLARGLILSQYLSGMSIPAMCDGLLRDAMNRVGDLWRHSEAGIFIEHRATDVCLEVLGQIRSTLAPALDHAPAAVGGGPSGDPYLLPSIMAATVLAEQGFRDHNLGPDTPREALLWAISHHRPAIVWISVSTRIDPAELRKTVDSVLERLAPSRGSLIVGGRGFDRGGLPSVPTLHVVDSMTELAAFAKGILAAGVSSGAPQGSSRQAASPGDI